LCSCSRIRAAKRLLSVANQHWHASLRDDRPTVKSFINKMNCTTTLLNARLQRLLVWMKPGKIGKQTRMDV
jgi:hypothetical protein